MTATLRYRSPLFQALLMGAILFTCPGMYYALTGLGAGGGSLYVNSLYDQSSYALYSVFAAGGLVSGSILNVIGPRPCLFIGSLTFALYVGSLWCLQATGNRGFVVAGGALLGAGCSLFWSAQGQIVMAYPPENRKSLYWAINSSLLSLGASIGALIPLAQNVRDASATSVSTTTYLAFVIIIFVGVSLTLLILRPTQVTRDDGTPVQATESQGWREEFRALAGIAKDKKLLWLLPLFWANNWFFSYQFALNSSYFNIRTRSLNNVLNWFVQIASNFALAAVLDNPRLSRRARARAGWLSVLVIVVAVYAGGVAFQVQHTRYDPTFQLIDWSQGTRFAGPFLLYFSYGITDSLLQSFSYWMMGSLTNDPKVLARYAGIYKVFQSAGAAVSFAVSSIGTAFNIQLGLVFGFLVFGLLSAYPVVASTTETSVVEPTYHQDSKLPGSVDSASDKEAEQA